MMFVHILQEGKVANPYDTTSYVILHDTPVELYMGHPESTRRWAGRFSLSPNARVDERMILMFQMDPSSDADLFLDVTINGTHIRRVSPRGGVFRTVIEVIGANVVESQNNHFVFEMGGSGKVKVSDVVLWFYTRLLHL